MTFKKREAPRQAFLRFRHARLVDMQDHSWCRPVGMLGIARRLRCFRTETLSFGTAGSQGFIHCGAPGWTCDLVLRMQNAFP